VGGFPQDEAVLERAVDIAARHRAALVVVHIVDLPVMGGLSADSDTLRDQAAQAARDRIEVCAARLGQQAPALDIRVASGAPALCLIAMSDEIDPDLIVMRAHQRTSIADKILGSTTDRVIAGGSRPVLVVKRAVEGAYASVFVTTNGKDDAEGALRFTRRLLPAAELNLVQAVQVAPQLEEAMLRIGTGQSEVRAHLDELAQIATAELGALVAQAEGGVAHRVLRGDPAAALVREARATSVDLIVAGAGRSGLLRRAFVGSVARRLLRDAECDVLILYPEASDEAHGA
jgi:nucleotide-binding universal stress UspA family protein